MRHGRPEPAGHAYDYGEHRLRVGWRREHALRVWQAIQAVVALADMERATLAFAQRNKHTLLCSPLRDGHYQALSRAQSVARHERLISRRLRGDLVWQAITGVAMLACAVTAAWTLRGER